MRCDEFDDLVCDIVRDGLMETADRSEAVSHAATCESCASRLGAERYLNEALAIVVAAETESAPVSVRLALLQAFASHKSQAQAGPVTNARSRWKTAAKAAAVLIIVLAISFLVMTRRSHRPAAQPGPGGEVPFQATKPPTLPDARELLHGGERKRSKPIPRTGPHQPYVAGNSVQTARLNPTLPGSDALTDFIPLTHLSRSTAIESGQVIRVKLPLSAFVAFGLPVSPEHADEVVNAELVIGDDGVQRAIRLVR